MSSLTVKTGNEDTIRLPEWRNLVDVIENNWSYGSTHTYEEIEDILRISYGTSKFFTHINRARKELETRGKNLRNIRNVGYEVIKPDDTLEVAIGCMSRGTNLVKKAHTIVSMTPLSLVSRELRESYQSFTDWTRSKVVEQAGDVSQWLFLAKNPNTVMKLPMQKEREK